MFSWGCDVYAAGSIAFITPRSGVQVSPPLPNFSLCCNVYGHAAAASGRAVAAFCRISQNPPPTPSHALWLWGRVCMPVSNGRGRVAEDAHAAQAPQAHLL